MSFLVPEFIFADVTRITPDFLAQQDIHALVLDVDNTLTDHGSQALRPAVSAWLALMRENGILLTIASNNKEKRVAPFAEKIGLEYVSFACKPLPWGLAKARKRWNIPRSQIALVGDQVFTDVLGADFYGIRVLMVQPLSDDGVFTIRFKRLLEKPIVSAYYKRGGKLL